MNDRDTRRLQRAETLLIFCDNNSADLAAFPIVAEHLAKITTSVARVTTARASQAPKRVANNSESTPLPFAFRRQGHPSSS